MWTGTLDVTGGTNLGGMKKKFSTYEPIEMRHGLGAIFSVVLG